MFVVKSSCKKTKYHSFDNQHNDNKPKEKLSFRDFANKVFNEELGFYDLEEFQFEMAEWRLNNLDGVSLLLATRGIGKTDIITCLTSLYLIYREPTISVLLVSRKEKNVSDIMQLASSIITRSSDFFTDFDIKSILKGSIRTKQNQGKEASLYTGTCGGDLRGRGHPDYIVFDDILSFTSSKSSTNREMADNQFNEATSLMKRGVLLVGNVCHQLDIYTKLRGLNIPKFEIFHDDERIPDRRKPNLDLARQQGRSEAQIQADFFGVLLLDDSAPFFDTPIMGIDTLPEINSKMIAYYDFSMGKRDANALSIAFIYNFNVYIIGYAKVCRWSDFIRDTKEILLNLGIKHIYYENNTTGDEPNDIFIEYGINSTGLTTTINKRYKINRLIGSSHTIILISTENKLNRDYINDFKHYNPGDANCKDDAVDSATMCLIQMGIIKGDLKYA